MVGCRRRGTTVLLQVWDSGPGFSQRLLREILEPGIQPESGRSVLVEGMEPGLTISRGLAERLGHILEASSLPGRGSLFQVGLPLALEQIPPLPPVLA
ncbi:MAG: histidine kinase Hybrid [Rhodospirillaceae bacterium]|nr:MAG: histidine kinase Hybrid [Rhodospirillaceae bacterium]